MKIIMTLLVRDEEDILKENIDFHLKQGIDFIIATDNCSTDSTKEILKSYEKQGKLHYIYEPEDNYNQYKWVTKMAQLASSEYQADWIINNDADEFWWPREHKNLKEAFKSLDVKYNIIEAQRTNFVPLEQTYTKFYETMIYRELQSLNPLGKPLPPKQAHKALDNIIVHQGNHSVDGFKKKYIKYDLIEIFHFPIRTKEQLLNKIKKGGAAYERNTTLSKNIGNTWRSLYQQLRETGNLDHYLANNIYNAQKIEENIKNNILTKDLRLKEYLSSIYE